ncbi:MAG: DEAD/DEAH box helicase, partial [Planctomycetaceae bacterium]|nr:DEAD/DEAH box helicase [Planctomycetaceae bacterium]
MARKNNQNAKDAGESRRNQPPSEQNQRNNRNPQNQNQPRKTTSPREPVKPSHFGDELSKFEGIPSYGAFLRDMHYDNDWEDETNDVTSIEKKVSSQKADRKKKRSHSPHPPSQMSGEQKPQTAVLTKAVSQKPESESKPGKSPRKNDRQPIESWVLEDEFLFDDRDDEDLTLPSYGRTSHPVEKTPGNQTSQKSSQKNDAKASPKKESPPQKIGVQDIKQTKVTDTKKTIVPDLKTNVVETEVAKTGTVKTSNVPASDVTVSDSGLPKKSRRARQRERAAAKTTQAAIDTAKNANIVSDATAPDVTSAVDSHQVGVQSISAQSKGAVISLRIDATKKMLTHSTRKERAIRKAASAEPVPAINGKRQISPPKDQKKNGKPEEKHSDLKTNVSQQKNRSEESAKQDVAEKTSSAETQKQQKSSVPQPSRAETVLKDVKKTEKQPPAPVKKQSQSKKSVKPDVRAAVEKQDAVTDAEGKGEPFQFGGLKLSTIMLDALRAANYHEPSPVQAGIIPDVLAGMDIMGQARTGTGKTAAFVIPILEGLDECDSGTAPVALILVPTRELAVQVRDEAVKLSLGRKVRISACYGGKPIGQQIAKLRDGVDIVVGTPGRVLDLSRRGALTLDSLIWVVLDEADRMLDIGFRPDIEKILRLTPSDRQTLLLSATLPPPVVKLAERYMRNPKVIDCSDKQVAVETIDQYYITIDRDRKMEGLICLLKEQNPKQAIVFCRTKRGADRVKRQLENEFQSLEKLHGDMIQSTRDRVMAQLRAGKVQILVATDVVGRGIDISGISHIINYDIPQFCDDYVHRVGRTGRMGREGVAYTFVTAEEGQELTRIEMRINLLLKRAELKNFEAVSQIVPEEKTQKPVFGQSAH